MPHPLELGVDTFGDVTSGTDGNPLNQAQVIRNVLAEGILADQCGVDFIGLGEHHRDDFAISAPDVILAGLATRTTRLKLGTAVTVLSSDDPIRVFQRFSTIDAMSNGRAEVVLGRGSFTESFPLFGLDLRQYELLFSEKLQLFAEVLKQQPVTWEGQTRAPLQDQRIYPPIEGERQLKAWIGVGGTPESVVRAASYGLPLIIAIIGGDPARFRGHVDLFHRALDQFGKDKLAVGIHSHGYVAATDELAREELFTDYKRMRDRIGKERGWPPMSRADFDREISHGSLYCGSPGTVARKITKSLQTLGATRFDMKYSAGPLSHEKIMRCIELYGSKVIPLVRDMMAGSNPS